MCLLVLKFQIAVLQSLFFSACEKRHGEADVVNRFVLRSLQFVGIVVDQVKAFADVAESDTTV